MKLENLKEGEIYNLKIGNNLYIVKCIGLVYNGIGEDKGEVYGGRFIYLFPEELNYVDGIKVSRLFIKHWVEKLEKIEFNEDK